MDKIRLAANFLEFERVSSMETRNALGECVILTGQLLAEHVSSQQYLLKLFNEHTAILSRILETRKKEVDPSSATETQEQCSETILRHLDAHTGPKLSSPVPNSPPESTLLALRAIETSVHPRINM
jgi:hypothetical protein